LLWIIRCILKYSSVIDLFCNAATQRRCLISTSKEPAGKFIPTPPLSQMDIYTLIMPRYFIFYSCWSLRLLIKKELWQGLRFIICLACGAPHFLNISQAMFVSFGLAREQGGCCYLRWGVLSFLLWRHSCYWHIYIQCLSSNPSRILRAALLCYLLCQTWWSAQNSDNPYKFEHWSCSMHFSINFPVYLIKDLVLFKSQ